MITDSSLWLQKVSIMFCTRNGSLQYKLEADYLQNMDIITI